MIDNILIDYYPQQKALSEIEKWLCEDNEESVKGFYNNIPTIKKCFLEGKLITLTLNDETIGFLTWSEGEKYIEIDIFEIHKNFRKRGFGEFFIDKVGRKFASQGFIALKLFCEPSESEMFWKKLKFTKFQNRETLPDLSYFKPIINHLYQTYVSIQTTRLNFGIRNLIKSKRKKPDGLLIFRTKVNFPSFSSVMEIGKLE